MAQVDWANSRRISQSFSFSAWPSLYVDRAAIFVGEEGHVGRDCTVKKVRRSWVCDRRLGPAGAQGR